MSGTAVANPTERKPVRIDVVVNRQPVVLSEEEVTGLEIKQAAIAQGVTAIQLNFRLFRRDGERWEPVGDNEQITVHSGEQFRAQGKQEDS